MLPQTSTFFSPFRCFCFFVFFVLSLSGNAQDSLCKKKNIFLQTSPIKNKITVKASNSVNIGNRRMGERTPYPLANFRTELNYGLLSCLEIGAYFGYTKRPPYNVVSIDDAAFIYITPTQMLHYGGQLNFHPLGLWINKESAKMAIWLSYKYGGAVDRRLYKKGKTMHSQVLDRSVESGIGLGLSYAPWKSRRLKFHLEYNFGHWNLKWRTNSHKYDHDVRWGLAYTFN